MRRDSYLSNGPEPRLVKSEMKPKQGTEGLLVFLVSYSNVLERLGAMGTAEEGLPGLRTRTGDA